VSGFFSRSISISISANASRLISGERQDAIRLGENLSFGHRRPIDQGLKRLDPLTGRAREATMS